MFDVKLALVGSRARPTSHQTLSPTTCTVDFTDFSVGRPLTGLTQFYADGKLVLSFLT